MKQTSHAVNLTKAATPPAGEHVRRKNLLHLIDRRAWRGFAVLMGLSVLLGLLTLEAWVFVSGAMLTVLHLAFFRDPWRRPAGKGLLSPADGKVVEVSRVFEDRYLGEEAVKIGIFLSIFDVHVNRAPWEGSVEWLDYRPGKFLNALKAESLTHNESNWIGLEDEGRKMLVRQISGAIARRIHCDVKLKERISRGGKLGVICYGSRVECYFPARLFTPSVQTGMRVRTGRDILGEWKT